MKTAPTNLIIRRAEAKDASALASLFALEAMLAFTDVPPHTGLMYWEKRLAEYTDAAHLPLVAVIENAIVGLSLMKTWPNHIRRKHQASLTLLAVRPTQRKRGIGRSLVNACIRACDDWLNVRRIEVAIDDSVPLAKFYASFGFESEGVKAKDLLHDGRVVSARVMSRINPINMAVAAACDRKTQKGFADQNHDSSSDARRCRRFRCGVRHARRSERHLATSLHLAGDLAH
jgi:L-phenylalanine/L-methionine N-acetyltransferase